ncbi:MAG: transcriptional regulator [Marmoricola sp.]|nr:transcriptional regulator [Marmoricola sp.]
MTTSLRSTPPSETALPEREALVAAALEALRDSGARSLTVDDVLARAGLGTRAFYRHFASRSELITQVFVQAARTEAERLRERMASAPEPVGAVIAWIDGRLDLAFDDAVQSDLKHVSREAQATHAADPARMAAVHAAMLAPLVEQLTRGARSGAFTSVDPVADAHAIDSVTWASIERRWAGDGTARDQVRSQVLTFCLRAVGARSGHLEEPLDRRRQ